MKGDVRQAHNEMRVAAGTKNIWIVGGGDLAGQFHDAGLLDELIVQIGSVTLGRGKQLFPRRVLSPIQRLIAVRQMGVGMVELRYQVVRQRLKAEKIVSRLFASSSYLQTKENFDSMETFYRAIALGHECPTIQGGIADIAFNLLVNCQRSSLDFRAEQGMVILTVLYILNVELL